MDKIRRQVINGNEISELYTFSLSGVQQKVLIEGKSNQLPVVICLHGGPGTPIPFSVGCRGMFPEFTDKFIMVYWDQLGCGINDCQLKDKYGIDDFVQMTRDLISNVKTLFPKNKILLFGMSWGSVLALRCSEIVSATVCWGQITHSLFFNEIVFSALENSGMPSKKLNATRSVTPDSFTAKDLKLISGYIKKYTDGYTNKKGKQAPMGKIIKGLLTSPDYSMKDFKAIVANGTLTGTRLWPELIKLNLSDELVGVQNPYFILQGDSDIVAPTEYVAHIIKNAHNPRLKLSVIKDSGHMPGTEGMEAVFDALLLAAESCE